MRVVLDVSPLSRAPTGVGTYVRGMAAGLALALARDGELCALALASRRGAREIQAALDGIEAERRLLRVPYPYGVRLAWTRLGWPPVERLAGRLDVFHPSDWMQPAQRGGVRATTIYDLVPLRFPEWTTPRTRRLAAAKLADARRCHVVFAISRYTASDARERLGLSEERLRVAYPGLDPVFSPTGEREPGASPYLLAVGTLEPRKNVRALLAAFAVLRRERPELELRIAGPAGWGERPPSGQPGVRWLGYVGNERLARLYRGAAALLFPSHFEGFGLPVVEAMACGAPVAASSHPSLDEACGAVARRADPDDPEAFAAAVEEALGTTAKQRAAGVEHAARFTWEACGRALLDGYRAAL